jgi:hypothetical protein
MFVRTAWIGIKTATWIYNIVRLVLLRHMLLLLVLLLLLFLLLLLLVVVCESTFSPINAHKHVILQSQRSAI